jgi:hypothetical protein
VSPEKFLIDTTAWVLFFRGDKSVEDKIKSLVLEDRALITEIIILETLRGARTQNEYDLLYHDLKSLAMLTAEEEVWEKSYKIGFSLKRAGMNIPSVDILIASIAVHHSVPLLHRDRHFPLMASLLKINDFQI